MFGWIHYSFGCQNIDMYTELLMLALMPVGVVGLALGLSLIVKRSVLPALPFVLRITYLLYPIISSRGFQVAIDFKNPGVCSRFMHCRICVLVTGPRNMRLLRRAA
jgi:hypothetical protein